MSTEDAAYHFSDWYRPVDNQLTAETQDSRIAAIKTLMKNNSQSFWLDVIRIYAGVPVKNIENKTAFVKAFKDVDAVFPVSGNDHLLQVLAGILLCFSLETEAEQNNTISLAISCLNFLGQYNQSIAVPVTGFAADHITVESENIRSLEIDTQQGEIDGLFVRKEDADYEFVAADHSSVVDAVSSILHVQKVFSEETNILWWLFGEASITFDESLKAIGLPKVLPIIAKELTDLLQFDLGTKKIKSIINKAVLNSVNPKNSGKEFSPFEMISKLTADESSLILNRLKPATEFTPLLSALYKSVILGTSSDWATAYSAEFNGGDLKKNFDPAKIGMQLFNEFLLLKNMN